MMATYSPSELVTDVMSPGTTSSLLAEMRSKHSFHHHHGQSSSPRALPAHPPGQFLSQSRSAALDQSANGNREHEASIGDNPSSSSSHFPSSSSSSSPSKLAGGLNDSRYDQNTLGERGKDRNRGGHDQTDQVMGDDQHEGRNVGDGAEENENQGEREADDADADEASSPIASPDDEAEEEEEEEEDEEEEEEEEESPFDFLQNFDPSLFSSGFNDTPSLPSAASSGQGQQTNPQPNDTEFYSNIIQMLTHLLGSSNHGLWPSGAATPNGQSGASPIPIAYSSPASAFTPLPNHAVPKGLAPPPPVQKGAQGSQSRNSSNSNLPDLQPLINSLLSRLSGQTNAAKKAGPVREQELTALLQSLMAQQQEQQKRNSFQQEQHQFQHVGNAPHQFSSSANTPSQTASRPMGFADLVFEDEDEDDPDFNPDINSEFPLPSAWNLAVQDVVGSEESRAAAAAAAAAAKDLGTVGATPTSGVEKDRDTFEGRQRAGTPPTQTDSAAGLTFVQVVSPSGRPMRSTRRKNASDPTDSLQGQDAANQTGMNHVRGMEVNVMVEDGHQERHGSTEAGPPKKRGRKAYYTEEEARRRRLERNAHYAREKRRRMREEKEAAEAAKAAEKEATTWESEKVIPRDQDVRLKEAFLELRAENRMLRAELERMREENARLRAQREIGEIERGGAGYRREAVRARRERRYRNVEGERESDQLFESESSSEDIHSEGEEVVEEGEEEVAEGSWISKVVRANAGSSSRLRQDLAPNESTSHNPRHQTRVRPRTNPNQSSSPWARSYQHMEQISNHPSASRRSSLRYDDEVEYMPDPYRYSHDEEDISRSLEPELADHIRRSRTRVSEGMGSMESRSNRGSRFASLEGMSPPPVAARVREPKRRRFEDERFSSSR